MKKSIIILILLSFTACNLISSFKGNGKENGFVYIPHNASFQQVLDSISPLLNNLDEFKKYAESEDYPKSIQSGKYKIEKGESSFSILDKLQSGEQVETKLTIKNSPTIYHMAAEVSKQLEVDSASVINAVLKWAEKKDTALNAETVKQFFIPNTYFVYWNMSPDEFVERMYKEYKKIWTDARLAKAKEVGLTPLEVVTMASIVQLEAGDPKEQAKVAQAYFNRLHKDMRLEADPTSIYAYKLENGFNNKTQRVYKKWTWSSNAYNTYRNKGLPPAPICLPNVQAIDAVLNPDGHEYVYFCADPGKPGYHLFTNDYEQHLKNAAAYRKWLEDNHIK